MATIPGLALSAVPKVDWKAFIGQQDEGYTLILGPSGIGKTVSGLSVSEAFDQKRMGMAGPELAKLPLITLDDVMHLGFDSGALDGMRGYGMMPIAVAMQKYIASLGERGPIKFTKELGDLLEAAYQPGMTDLLDDTLSSLDDILVTYWVQHKGDDTMAMWSDLAATHSDYRSEVNTFTKRHNLRRVALVHVIPKQKIASRAGVDGKAMAILKAEAEGREQDLLVPALTGKSAGVYINHASMMLALDDVAPVGSSATTRKLLCGKKAPKYQTKNRHVAITGEEMSGYLGDVMKLIRNHRS